MSEPPAMPYPQLSNASLDTTICVQPVDEYGQAREGYISAERPLTIYLDKREILTLMTMGSQPELLVLGWLRNQNLITELVQLKAIQVDWETESVAVTTFQGVEGLDEKLGRKTVTTGCGQGTMFGNLMDRLDQLQLPAVTVQQSQLYDTLHALTEYNEIYRRAGAVHGCALCAGTDILSFVEDVGRHNAVDTIAGHMWLHGIVGGDKLFYTTGRLTSEMVIKVAQMGVPVLLSRSGVTEMGLALAKKLGVILIARAKGRHFLVYNGVERVVFDAMPRRVEADA
ncbi:MAG: formate dehydrogenase accessory sulfurtransferase FdhD [Thiothrix litoralis]|uniref:formate dehydrogenase accessory sulfurtransferase FdhD n=1 Tax=Thiothrix litoralis TaxID=2891210 RepID=UPI003C71EFF6